jgi:hypothetical protein
VQQAPLEPVQPRGVKALLLRDADRLTARGGADGAPSPCAPVNRHPSTFSYTRARSGSAPD